MKKWTFRIIILMLGAGLLFCLYNIVEYYVVSSESQDSFKKLAELRQFKKAGQGFESVYKDNEDLVGWIYIEDTPVDYPVMQTKHDPEYYLHRDFYHKYSSHGVPFLEVECDIESSDNLLIYGHHMRDGTMFAVLEKYKNESFFQLHSIIKFDTLTEEREYQVIAAFKTQANTGDSTNYSFQNYIELDSEEEFNIFYNDIKSRSIYDTGVNAEYGDTFITLTTCEYSSENGRMVVIAKR